MLRKGFVTLLSAAICLALLLPISAFAGAQKRTSAKLRVIYLVPKTGLTSAQVRKLAQKGATNAGTIPMWNFTTNAYFNDGTNTPTSSSYSGTMVGRSPFAHGHRSTQITTYVVPIILKIGGETFDPTASDSCAPSSLSVDSLLLDSPIFQDFSFTMPSSGGTNVGTTQYLDAFQRANFWSLVGGTPYHTVFTTSPTVLSPITITVPSADGVIYAKSNFGGCRDLGLMSLSYWDTQAQSLISSTLAAEGVSATTFPQYIFDSVGLTTDQPPTLGGCCALGYHSAFTDGTGNLQTYSANDYDTSGAFNTNTSVLSHEVAEWMDDPGTSNPTPNWGAEGQVSGCQNNLETGDPLSPGFSTPTNPFTETGTNGVSYTLQELAFYSWFLGAPSTIGGNSTTVGVTNGSTQYFSDNGTFTGAAIGCSPGGTFTH